PWIFCYFDLTLFGAGRYNLHRHEMGVRFRPGERLLFRVEEPVDDECIAFSRVPPTRARGFATDHTWPAIYGHTRRIAKDNFAGIGNFLWIDGAMPGRQSVTAPRCVLP